MKPNRIQAMSRQSWRTATAALLGAMAPAQARQSAGNAGEDAPHDNGGINELPTQ
jgi:hypothetical protein